MLSDFNPKILVKKEHYPLIDDYFCYLKTGWKHYAKTEVSSEVKLKKLELLEKALRKDFPLKNSLIANLQNSFIKENLSLYLLLDMLYAWRYLARGVCPKSEEQLSELVNLSISPFARLITALYDENPSTYFPLTSLFSVLFLLEEFQKKSTIVNQVKLSKRQKVSKLKGLMKNSAVILSLINSKRLKFRLAQCLNTAKILIQKFENNEQVKISILDNIIIFLYSTTQFVSVRHKPLEKNKI